MKKKIFNIITIIFLLITLTTVSAVAKDEGVDDLRGRWDVEWFFYGDEGNLHLPLILFVNDLVPSAYTENRSYAGGCMRSPDSDALMPMYLQADFNPEEGSYDLIVYSTLVPADSGQPFVIRLSGKAYVFGEGVTDDTAGGLLKTESDAGEWSALHHDRRRTKCPSVRDSGLTFEGDVHAHRDMAFSPAADSTLLEAYTVIVSSLMQVVTPDGETIIVEPYSDIFSPDIDFVGRFRYLIHFEGTPLSGGPYSFILLDSFGHPIEGTEATDVWHGCPQGAPAALSPTILGAEDDVNLDWTDVPPASGFDPAATTPLGFYQIAVQPNFESSTDYGAMTFLSEHIIPWNSFEPGIEGNPDGWDFGTSLEGLDPGPYRVQVAAFGVAVDESSFGLECAVYDSVESLLMEKSEAGQLIFTKTGSISGTLYDNEMNPLANIAVDIEEGGFGTCTDENGNYNMSGLPLGTYNVVAGRDFCGPHNYIEASVVGVGLSEETPHAGDVDFSLVLGGSISGIVYEESTGDPLGGIYVEACVWGVPEPYCKGATTNSDGSYIILGMPSGTFFVHVPEQAGWMIEFYENTPDPGSATPVSVEAGTDTGSINFSLSLIN